MNLNNYNSYDEKLSLCYKFLNGEMGEVTTADTRGRRIL